MKVTTRRDEMILGQAQKSAINGLNSTAVQATLQTGFVCYDVTVVQTFTRKEKSVWQLGIDEHFKEIIKTKYKQP